MELLDFIQKSTDAQSLDELSLLLTNALKDICGLDSFVFTLVTDHPTIGLPAGHGVMSNYPTDWLNHYVHNNYDLVDPVRHYGFRAHGPFAWSDIPQSFIADRRSRDCFYGGIEAGLNNGIALRLRGPCGEVAGLAAASEKTKEDLAHVSMMLFNAISNQFYLRFIQLHGPDVERIKKLPKLTNRERTVLSWIARGKNDQDISDILKISHRYVRRIVEDIRDKYCATTRTTAVLMAVASGEIDSSDLVINRHVVSSMKKSAYS